ncbi:MAG: DUF2334 domain-containing protein [Gemmatimonadaceae bacterium]
MRIVLAIHDVTPALELEVRALWSLSVRRGVRPALFVVPDWHGEWPIERHPRFVHWLRARADEGAEVFLHGERHDEAGSRRRWLDSLRAVGRSRGEGEFLTLGATQARERIERGASRLRRSGLDPIGFVAPAWLERRECSLAVAEAGLLFSEDERCVRLHELGMHVRSPIVRWSARSLLRARVSATVAEVRWQLQRNAELVRIALQPGDLSRAAVARSVGRALERWLALRPAVRYAQI